MSKDPEKMIQGIGCESLYLDPDFDGQLSSPIVRLSLISLAAAQDIFATQPDGGEVDRNKAEMIMAIGEHYELTVHAILGLRAYIAKVSEHFDLDQIEADLDLTDPSMTHNMGEIV